MKLSTTGLAISLTPEETELFIEIPSYEEIAERRHERWYEKWPAIAQAMKKLLELLTERDAIPKIRLKIFSNSDYAETKSKSRLEAFNSNGRFGDDIITHSHFTKYLEYFVNGPDLPKSLVVDFQRLVDREARPEELRLFIRQKIKQTGLRDSESEIFRLAVECGLPIYTAKSLRSEAKTASRKN